MKKNKKIFIDTENVQNYNCLKSLNLTEEDEIFLFFSQNTKSIKVESLNLIFSFGCRVKSMLLKVRGNNSLDFHIITNLALNHSTKYDYYIVSNDKEYESSVDQFNLLGYNNVYALNWSKVDEKQNNSSLANKNDELEIKRIYKSSKNKSEFHNKLCEKFGMEGQKLYKKYKCGF